MGQSDSKITVVCRDGQLRHITPRVAGKLFILDGKIVPIHLNITSRHFDLILDYIRDGRDPYLNLDLYYVCQYLQIKPSPECTYIQNDLETFLREVRDILSAPDVEDVDAMGWSLKDHILEIGPSKHKTWAEFVCHYLAQHWDHNNITLALASGSYQIRDVDFTLRLEPHKINISYFIRRTSDVSIDNMSVISTTQSE